ncbi:MAG: hypothetical protein ACK5MN_03320 [Lachnospiraceae bacterium]
MASVKMTDVPQERAMWGELFKLREKYYYPEEGDVYWEDYTRELIELERKYPTRFTTYLTRALREEAYEQSKDMGHKQINIDLIEKKGVI